MGNVIGKKDFLCSGNRLEDPHVTSERGHPYTQREGAFISWETHKPRRRLAVPLGQLCSHVPATAQWHSSMTLLMATRRHPGLTTALSLPATSSMYYNKFYNYIYIVYSCQPVLLQRPQRGTQKSRRKRHILPMLLPLASLYHKVLPRLYKRISWNT